MQKNRGADADKEKQALMLRVQKQAYELGAAEKQGREQFHLCCVKRRGTESPLLFTRQAELLPNSQPLSLAQRRLPAQQPCAPL